METRIYAGKCRCKRQLAMRIISGGKKQRHPKSDVVVWIIYGVCGHCKTVYLQGAFAQKKEPVIGKDFTIDEHKVASSVVNA